MNTYEKLLKVQTELKAPKNKRNTFGKYNYRSCEDILEAVKPLLKEVKATVFIEDDVRQMGERVYVIASAYFKNVEKPDDETICVQGYAREPLDKKGMDEPQITGTASSYARKYALNGLFLIDDVKDPDSDEYHNETEQKAKASTRRKKDPEEKTLDDFVNAGQIETLNMLLKKADVAPEKFCEIYNIAIISEFPAEKYEDAVNKLETAIKTKKGDK